MIFFFAIFRYKMQGMERGKSASPSGDKSLALGGGGGGGVT